MAQTDGVLEAVREAIARRGNFELAALHTLTKISGSVVICLALQEGVLDVDQAWTAAHIDETWQAERWGEDAEAVQNRNARYSEFQAAEKFLKFSM